VQALCAAQYPLHVWTVDDPEVALRFTRLGTVSVTTNRPEWLRRELKSRMGGTAAAGQP
jgi:glycerophosphoryl diester phosphodiesterase